MLKKNKFNFNSRIFYKKKNYYNNIKKYNKKKIMLKKNKFNFNSRIFYKKRNLNFGYYYYNVDNTERFITKKFVYDYRRGELIHKSKWNLPNKLINLNFTNWLLKFSKKKDDEAELFLKKGPWAYNKKILNSIIKFALTNKYIKNFKYFPGYDLKFRELTIAYILKNNKEINLYNKFIKKYVKVFPIIYRYSSKVRMPWYANRKWYLRILRKLLKTKENVRKHFFNDWTLGALEAWKYNIWLKLTGQWIYWGEHSLKRRIPTGLKESDLFFNFLNILPGSANLINNYKNNYFKNYINSIKKLYIIRKNDMMYDGNLQNKLWFSSSKNDDSYRYILKWYRIHKKYRYLRKMKFWRLKGVYLKEKDEAYDKFYYYVFNKKNKDIQIKRKLIDTQKDIELENEFNFKQLKIKYKNNLYLNKVFIYLKIFKSVLIKDILFNKIFKKYFIRVTDKIRFWKIYIKLKKNFKKLNKNCLVILLTTLKYLKNFKKKKIINLDNIKLKLFNLMLKNSNDNFFYVNKFLKLLPKFICQNKLISFNFLSFNSFNNKNNINLLKKIFSKKNIKFYSVKKINLKKIKLNVIKLEILKFFINLHKNVNLLWEHNLKNKEFERLLPNNLKWLFYLVKNNKWYLRRNKIHNQQIINLQNLFYRNSFTHYFIPGKFKLFYNKLRKINNNNIRKKIYFYSLQKNDKIKWWRKIYLRQKKNIKIILRTKKILQKEFNYEIPFEKIPSKLILKKKLNKDFNIKTKLLNKVRKFFIFFYKSFFKRLFLKRLKSNLYFYINLLLNYTHIIKIFFIKSNNYFNITSIIVVEFIALKLLQKFKLKTIVNRLFKLFKSYKSIGCLNGYKIAINGRFSRRIRVTYFWKLKGNLSLTSKVSHIDFAQKIIPLKHGCCSINIWLSAGKDFF